jgi:hypothetical protein
LKQPVADPLLFERFRQKPFATATLAGGFGGMRVKTQQDHASIAMTRQIERPRRAVVDPDSSNNVRPP